MGILYLTTCSKAPRQKADQYVLETGDIDECQAVPKVMVHLLYEIRLLATVQMDSLKNLSNGVISLDVPV